MARNTGVSNYVFEDDIQAAEDALTEKLYEYAIQHPKASGFSFSNYDYNLGGYAKTIQYENAQRGDKINMKALKEAQDLYLRDGAKWLSQERRRKTDAELLDAIKNNPVFRRRLITLQNPDTFSDSFWTGY